MVNPYAFLRKGAHSKFKASLCDLLPETACRRRGERFVLRPVRLLRVWVSEGLTQANS